MISSRQIPLILLLVLASFVQAQDVPTITIKKDDKLDLSIETFTGPEGAAVRKVLENDLALADSFHLTESGKAGFLVSGIASSGDLEGKVLDRGGKVVLAANYSGSTRSRAHQFADDIVETLTGKPGIANSRIAFVATKTGRKEIYTADYDGANVQQLTRDNAISVGPALNPEGSKLAYTGYQSGYADVYVIDLGSGKRSRIIKYPGTNTGAAFSPDGNRLAVSLSKDGNPELYITNISGGSARRLTRTRGAESSPSWAPNGQEIVYSAEQNGGPQLYRISSGGGSGQRIATGYGYCTEPNWSPDGKKIAFNVRSGGFQVAVYDLANGGTRIVSSGGNFEDPIWGPDSRHILCAGGGALYLLDTETGRKVKVLDGLGTISEPTWSR